ncbi:MAG: GDP-mannose 4,6-dehydratase [Candidatus Aminicenantes bacterium]|nr:MAG: GDP-mannose 4,6-dehydratase [Candidatus Aminicenantes bacterium]
MNIFITGATGFVGCYLRKFLKSPEHDIWGSAYPEVPDVSSDDHIFYLDIRSDKDVFKCIQEIKPDWVFHLAAISNVRHSWNRRKETLETNIIGTLNLFEGIREFSPGARVLFISSSDIYGMRSLSKGPLTEKEEVLIMNPYAYTKWSAELLSEFYTRIENMDIVIARSFPHTGPGQSADFVCSDWAFQIARIEKGLSDPLIQVGDISVERDFTDVRDVVRAYVRLMEKGRVGEVYNVCSGRSYSLESILTRLLSFSQKEISVRVDSRRLRKVDIPRLVGDNRKIKEAISWESRIPIEQSLKDLLEYWRQRV